MNLSLFVDESSNFESKHGEWVVAGLLCRGPRKVSEARLGEVLAPLPQRFGLVGRQDLHLTELRGAYGHPRALAMAADLFEALRPATAETSLFAVVNVGKIKVGTAERTYRQMVLDLLALVEASLGPSDTVDHLDLVVATRTHSETGERMTTHEEMTGTLLKSLPDALAEGLASRGLIKSLSAGSVELQLEQANRSWGLVCADFLANIVYHRARPDESRLLGEVRATGRLRIFETVSNPMERRARVAERDGDLPGAIVRWALLEGSKRDSLAIDNIARIFDLILSEQIPAALMASVETVIEGIRRQGGDNPARLAALNRVGAGLGTHDTRAIVKLPIYRLRNYALVIANQLGNAVAARGLLQHQEPIAAEVSLYPEGFPLVLEGRLLAIETLVNELEFERALEAARAYFSTVESYKECWELLAGDGATQIFEQSRVAVRALSILARCMTLGARTAGDLDAAERLLVKLEALPLSNLDASRARTIRLEIAIRRDCPEAALAAALEASNTALGPFELAWTARAAVDATLRGHSPKSAAKEVLKRLRAAEETRANDHPAELLWREQGLLTFLLERDKVGAKACLDTSERLIRTQGPSPLTDWKRVLLESSKDAVDGRNRSTLLQAAPKAFEGRLDGTKDPMQRLLAARQVYWC